MTPSKGLNSISRHQLNPTTSIKKKCDQLLDHLTTHPDAKIRFCASDVMSCIHLDASHVNEPGAKSTARGHYFVSLA